MPRLSIKLLTVLLALLVGLSPLQGVLAGVAAFLDQEEGMYHMTDVQGHDGVMDAAPVVDRDCGQNSVVPDCSGYSCSFCGPVVSPVLICLTDSAV